MEAWLEVLFKRYPVAKELFDEVAEKLYQNLGTQEITDELRAEAMNPNPGTGRLVQIHENDPTKVSISRKVTHEEALALFPIMMPAIMRSRMSEENYRKMREDEANMEFDVEFQALHKEFMNEVQELEESRRD